jgi:dsRNA-specific ribonuclease
VTTADLLLHPVRLRIVRAFLGDRALTTAQLRAELPDVPTGSLYRHVAKLVDAGVLAVVAERRVRGALERTYVLRTSAARLSVDEIATMSREEHRQAFLAFVAGLIGDVDRYLAREQIDPLRDGASYNLAAMWVDDAEFAELTRELNIVLQRHSANQPQPGRKRRILATVLLPADEPDPA